MGPQEIQMSFVKIAPWKINRWNLRPSPILERKMIWTIHLHGIMFQPYPSSGVEAWSPRKKHKKKTHMVLVMAANPSCMDQSCQIYQSCWEGVEDTSQQVKQAAQQIVGKHHGATLRELPTRQNCPAKSEREKVTSLPCFLMATNLAGSQIWFEKQQVFWTNIKRHSSFRPCLSWMLLFFCLAKKKCVFSSDLQPAKLRSITAEFDDVSTKVVGWPYPVVSIYFGWCL